MFRRVQRVMASGAKFAAYDYRLVTGREFKGHSFNFKCTVYM